MQLVEAVAAVVAAVAVLGGGDTEGAVRTPEAARAAGRHRRWGTDKSVLGRGTMDNGRGNEQTGQTEHARSEIRAEGTFNNHLDERGK